MLHIEMIEVGVRTKFCATTASVQKSTKSQHELEKISTFNMRESQKFQKNFHRDKFHNFYMLLADTHEKFVNINIFWFKLKSLITSR